MDNQKEREVFEVWLFQTEKFKSRNKLFLFMLDENGNYEDIPVLEHWQTWQAAKAHVQEGFVLVPKEPSAYLVNHGHQVFLGHFNGGGQTGGRSLYFAYKAMIEAQEQKV